MRWIVPEVSDTSSPRYSGVSTMTATSRPTKPEKIAQRLLNSSAQRWYDPEVDLDWAAPLVEDKDFHPPHRVSIYGTELWERLTPEQRHELGKQEIAAIASFGIFAEISL